ncbi:peptidylprolyl isomerase [Algibacter luteus]|uniref:peptidylprolyl isomerase n=1 Tax=Algibacter luteus TaxID=1178825 RepID=A0A1M6A9S2_9FLAO|nr:peptidylprolyl isomerase [Algibacter luteus]SHI33208.1 peptidyl-prolyl cis-trans isomerase A (cyclophilin A) [Algibacter luteus]
MLFKGAYNVLILALLFIFLTACEEKRKDLEDGIYAEFVTNKGNMMAKLTYEKTPVTVANFVSLAEGTNTLVKDPYKKKAYFNGTIFHRIIENSIIQGGDPTGKGPGNPGYKFKDEFHPDLKHDKKGILSMANYGPKTNGSQFFITDVPRPKLDNKHSVFGELVTGFDVLDSISAVKTDKNDRPLKEVVIKEVNILRIGKSAQKFNAPKIFENHFIEEQRLEKQKKAKAEALLKATFKRFENQKTKAKTLDSGLYYYVSKQGEGEKLHENAQALVHYTVYTENGEFIKTSKLELAKALNVVDKNGTETKKYQPIIADIGPDAQMIPGFKEGLQQLHVGDQATLFIPYHLGFGEAGGNTVPGKTNIIFEVEVLKLLK